MSIVEKLMVIAIKHNFYLTEDGGEFRVLKIILDNMNEVERENFFADTFMMFDNEINAIHDACRDLTDDELKSVAEEDMHEYRRGN